jgi:hypothetical protein
MMHVSCDWRSDKECSHDREGIRLQPSAIDELNRQLGTQRLPARQFGLLMAVLAALLLLLYVQIIW